MLRPHDDRMTRLDARDAQTARLEAASLVRPGWHGRAFLAEALAMLAFLLMSMAVLVGVFANARVESEQAQRQTDAIHLAQNAAEQFAADPAGADGLAFEQDGLAVSVQVEQEPQEAGTLYRAVVSVIDNAGVGANDQGDETYRLETARYVPGGRGGSAAAVAGAEAASDGGETGLASGTGPEGGVS